MESKNDINNTFIEKKTFIFSIFLLALIIVMSIVICFLLLNDKILSMTNTFDDNTDIEVGNQIEDEKDVCIYEIKEYNKKIGIYKNNSLIYTLNIYTFTLPESDQILLKQGIITSSQKDLIKIIEEFS